jgi:phosphatidate phosphatase LPIN
MKIGDAGEAFFIFETDEDIPDNIATSPLLEATKPGQSNAAHAQRTGRFGAKEDGQEAPSQSEDTQEPDFLDLNADSTSKDTQAIEPPVQASPASNVAPEVSKITQDDGGTQQEEKPGLLARTAAAGKAALGMVYEAETAGKDMLRDHQIKEAVKEVEREKRSHVKDNLLAASNFSLSQPSLPFGKDKGDEVLPDVPDKANAPEVTYGHGMSTH